MAITIVMLRPDRGFQTCPVGNTHPSLRQAYQPSIPEILQQSRNCFATCSDHLRHFPMRVRSRHVCRSGHRGMVIPLQKKSGEFVPDGYGQSERAYLQMCLLIITAHLVKGVQRGFVMGLDESNKVFSLDKTN